MATPTEQNPINQLPPNGEVSVIVIKLHFDLQERLLCFPFLHKVREKYPAATIHFITPKKNIEVLNLLPFKAFYHEIEEDDLSNIFHAYRYSVMSKIYNVDIYISLTNSFVDASLGLFFRAKKRVGFSDGWKTLVLTHKTPRLYGHHVTEEYFSLYRAMVEANVEIKIKVLSRELEPIIPEWDLLPYIAINLSPLRDAMIEDEVLELINCFENKRIVLFSSENQEEIQLLLEPFFERLSKKNTYINFIHKSWIDLAKMMSFSRGVITFNGPAASLSAYVGTRTLILYDTEDPQRYAPFNFEAELLILGVNDPTLINTLMSTGILQHRKQFSMSEVYGKALDFFKL
jgi:ADP-heptose:LPS heptosyltransferase